MEDVSTLGLSRRVLTILDENGITTPEALTARNARQLLSFPRFGGACLSEVLDALERAGLELAEDPYASYVCARHGDPSWDTNLANLFLCDACGTKWQDEAFNGEAAAYQGDPLEGFCLNCNVFKQVRLRQWFLCGTCERVARSIGRSVVAERFVTEYWEGALAAHAPHVQLRSTDVPTLRRRHRNAKANKRAEIDFVAHDTTAGENLFGFELKTGKSHLTGTAQVGAKMGQFQLDTSDCDDITAVMEREHIPVYLLHVQVIDRAHPPTVEYKALAGWWTDLFRMHDHFERVQRRPRETRDAAYFSTRMFEDLSTFVEHVRSGKHMEMAARLKRDGIPDLYWS